MEEVASRKDEFIQANSPDGGFLQSEKWRKFKESFGRKTLNISGEGFWANIIEHTLPIVGKYFYIPRGPVIPAQAEIQSLDSSTALGMTELINLAKKENAGWIRFDANDQETLEIISKAKLFQNQSSALKIRKAPHDMQPRELFIIDITKSEEELLAGMKAKTRYNIKLAIKHKVSVRAIPTDKFLISNKIPNSKNKNKNFYLEEFLRLVKITARRDKITPHPDVYYRKMFETIPAENIRLYVAEYDGKIVAANINIFFGKMVTYVHGASDHNYKNVMAPYLLQWQAILDAKAAGCNFYDLGGVKTHNANRKSHSANPTSQSSSDYTRYGIRDTSSWAGITKFKTGFSVTTEPIKFPGSYDIVINSFLYNLYRILQRIKALF